jgi:uncharacterized membrane-anchored protein YitT (DUF2179 family)
MKDAVKTEMNEDKQREVNEDKQHETNEWISEDKLKSSAGKAGKLITNVALIVLGNAIYAAGVVLFILPTGLITGGTTGIALIINHFTGMQISTFVGVFNVVMFALGYAVLGRKFAMSTLVSTFSYPVMLGIIQKAVGSFVLTDDLLLSALFGGLCIGLALAIVIRIGASTGGMDIPPLILQKTLRIPVSASMYVFDFAILIGQMLFTPRQTCLYGILLVLVYTITLDKLLAVGASRTKLEIVSREHEAIRKAILEDLDRSVTLLHGQTGYFGLETDVLYCVIAPRELYKLERIVYSIDPDAFVVMSRATSVHGKGFSKAKEYLVRQ